MYPVNMRAMDGTVKVILAEEQPQYTPLPALVYPDGMVVTEWAPTPEELRVLADGGRVRLFQWTFGRGFQPVAAEMVTAEQALPLEPTQ
jgi:hypothetical protein